MHVSRCVEKTSTHRPKENSKNNSRNISAIRQSMQAWRRGRQNRACSSVPDLSARQHEGVHCVFSHDDELPLAILQAAGLRYPPADSFHCSRGLRRVGHGQRTTASKERVILSLLHGKIYTCDKNPCLVNGVDRKTSCRIAFRASEHLHTRLSSSYFAIAC